MGNSSSRLGPNHSIRELIGSKDAVKAGLNVNEKSSKQKKKNISGIKLQGVSTRTDEMCKLVCELVEKIKEEMTSIHDQYYHFLKPCNKDDELHKQYCDMPYNMKMELHRRDFHDCLWIQGINQCDGIKDDITSVQSLYHKLKLECERLSSVQRLDCVIVRDDAKKKWVGVKDFYKNILQLAGLTVTENSNSGIKLQGIPSQGGELYKLISELCKRIEEEFSSLYIEYLNLKPSNGKFLTKEKVKNREYRYQGISYDLDDKLHKMYHEMPSNICYQLHIRDFEDCLWFKAVKNWNDTINTITYSEMHYYKLKILYKKLAAENAETQRSDEMEKVEKIQVVQEDSGVKMTTDAASHQDVNDENDFEKIYSPNLSWDRLGSLYKGVTNMKSRRMHLEHIQQMERWEEMDKMQNKIKSIEQAATSESKTSDNNQPTMQQPSTASNNPPNQLSQKIESPQQNPPCSVPDSVCLPDDQLKSEVEKMQDKACTSFPVQQHE